MISALTKKEKYFFLGLLALGAALILINLGQHDIIGDDGTYAFRSIHYFDYMASIKQTTPIQWFGFRPWWSYLSFHDHPPIFFLINFIFLKILGISTLVSRLPTALAAIGSLAAIFFWMKEKSGTPAGLAALAALAVNNYFIWIGRIGLLEGIMILFLILGALYFERGFDKDEKNFFFAGIFLGLAFLTKYVVLFALPGFLIYALSKSRRAKWKTKGFWLGVAAFMIVIGPVLIYNFALFRARGHFDVQFADLFNQSHSDWTILSDRAKTLNLLSIGGTLSLLADGMSLPYALAALAALAYLLLRSLRGRQQLPLPALILISFIIFLAFVGGGDERWVSALSPFAAAIIGLAVAPYVKNRLIMAGAAAVGVWALIYSVNTNHLVKPLPEPFTKSQNLWVAHLGYNELDAWVRKKLEGKFADPTTEESVRRTWYRYIKPEAIDFTGEIDPAAVIRPIIVYDQNLNWFSSLWIFERWRLYKNFMIMNAEEFIKGLQDEESIEVVRQNFDDIYVISAGEEITSRASAKSPWTELALKPFKEAGTDPEVILDPYGRTAFAIYHLPIQR